MLNGPDGERACDRLRLARHVIFLAHGYNVNRSNGRSRLANLASFIDSSPETAVVATLWPGDSVIPVVNYPFEGKTADDSAKALARFIIERNALRPGTRVSVMTHSLGARVGMEALKRLLGKNYPLSQVCLMAPAVVDYSLARSKDYRETTTSCERVTVLSSKHDIVLKYAFPAGNFLGVFPLFSNSTIGLALGYH
jgi:esterase/lipase superfamily enzyme